MDVVMALQLSAPQTDWIFDRTENCEQQSGSVLLCKLSFKLPTSILLKSWQMSFEKITLKNEASARPCKITLDGDFKTRLLLCHDAKNADFGMA